MERIKGATGSFPFKMSKPTPRYGSAVSTNGVTHILNSFADLRSSAHQKERSSWSVTLAGVAKALIVTRKATITRFPWSRHMGTFRTNRELPHLET